MGSVFYSDRRTVERSDGTRSYLCSLCDARVGSTEKGKPLTDDEVRNLVENGSLGAVSWAGRGY